MQLCLAAESRPAGGVLVYARLLQSTSSFLVPCTVYTTRRRVRPVRLGPHGGREPPRPQKARHEGLSQVLPVQPLREQVHPNQCCRGKFLIVQHFNTLIPSQLVIFQGGRSEGFQNVRGRACRRFGRPGGVPEGLPVAELEIRGEPQLGRHERLAVDRQPDHLASNTTSSQLQQPCRLLSTWLRVF